MSEKRSWVVGLTSSLPFSGRANIRHAYLEGRDAARAGNLDMRDRRAGELRYAARINGALAAVAFIGAGINLFVSLRDGSGWHGAGSALDAVVGTAQTMASYTQAFLGAKLSSMVPTPETAVANPAEFQPPDYETHPTINERLVTQAGLVGLWWTAYEGLKDVF